MTDIAVLKIDLRQPDRRRVGRQRQAASRRPGVGARQPVRPGAQPDVRHRQRQVAPQRQLRQPQPVSGISADRRGRESRQQRRAAGEHRRPGRRHQRGDLRHRVPGNQLFDSQRARPRDDTTSYARRATSTAPGWASRRSTCRRRFANEVRPRVGRGRVRRRRSSRRAGRQSGVQSRRRDPQVERSRGHRPDAAEPRDRRDRNRLDGQAGPRARRRQGQEAISSSTSKSSAARTTKSERLRRLRLSGR